MRLLFAGTPEPALPALRALLDTDTHQVAAVLTRPPSTVGRGRALAASPVAQLAMAAGIEVLTPPGPSDPDFLRRLAALDIDCAPVVAYGVLLRAEPLAVPRLGWVNLHFSLLPAWRGAAPVQHAVLNGDDITGASTFQIGPGLDDGPVFGVVTEQIRPRDTSGDLLDRLADSGARLLLATLDGIAEGTLRAVPQQADGISLAPKLLVADARIRCDQPAVALDRRVRACTPNPGAWLQFRGERLKLGPVQPAIGPGIGPEIAPFLAPGQLWVNQEAVLVGTATGPLQLGWVQPAGKRQQSALDWARGARLTEQDRFD